MFTDMVGYTSLGQKDESLSLALVDEQRKLVRPILTRHNGREVKTMGDAFLVEFPNALDAVRCAYDIQRASRELNFSLPKEGKIHLRVGLHLGDVTERDGDISGDAVNIASRIEPLAEDGGVCLTREVFDQVKNKFDLSLRPMGPTSLKNVQDPVEIYRIVMPWVEQKQATASEPDARRIAVLPFANMSPDPNDGYFADGMTEELISAISNIHELSVISRTSAMRYKGENKTVAEIGKELNVGTVLEGSVRKAGNRVRISTQLIEVVGDRPLWSQTYEKELLDIFGIQSDVAHRVAQALKVQILTKEKTRIEKKMTTNAEAYTQYLKGRLYQNQRSQESLTKALVYFELVIKKDPNFALAYSGLADCNALLSVYGFTPAYEAFAVAKELATKALELDGTLAEVHTSLAWVAAGHDWDWARAEQEFREAIELNPNYATASHWYAIFLATRGRLDEALETINRAKELDPFSAVISMNVGTILHLAGKYDQAIDNYRMALEISPDLAVGHIFLGLGLLHQSLKDEALVEFQKADDLSSGSALAQAYLAYFYGQTAARDKAKEMREVLEQRSKTTYVPPYVLAIVCSGLEDEQGVVEWLEKAIEEHHSIPTNLFAVIPLMVNSGSSSKRAELLQRLGLSLTSPDAPSFSDQTSA